MIDKISNEDIPASMKMPTNDSLSEKSSHLKKEVDAWLKEGNKKTIIPTKEPKAAK
tara:strand:+ start:42 stop:209 length:168 start_codon:yes stop_codon:yes gene_type:complete